MLVLIVYENKPGRGIWGISISVYVEIYSCINELTSCYRYDSHFIILKLSIFQRLNKGSMLLSHLWSGPSYVRYNDIAKHALDVVKSKSLDSTRALDDCNVTEPEDQPEGFDR
jgi:hypothetical protein